MNSLKYVVKKYFSNFAFFYSYLRNKIFIAIGLSITISVLDAFGLSMFLPLLQVVDNKGVVDAEGMGNLRFLIHGIEALGIELTIGFVLLFMVLFFIFKGAAYYISLVYGVVLQQSFIKQIRLKLVTSLNKMSFKGFTTSDAGRIQNIMSGEVDRVVGAYNSYFGSFQQGIMVVVYMSFAFLVDAQFAILISVGGIITNFLYKTIYGRTKSASKKFAFSSNVYQGQIIQHVGNFKYLKATGMIEKYAEQLKRTIENIENSRKRIGILSSIGASAREPLLVIVVACVILIQTQLLSGSMSTILISLLFFYRALTALVYMQLSWNEFMGVSGSLENMREYQKEIASYKEKNGSISFAKFKESIKINNVSFSYGETKVLKNINLSISKNESVAFVGESGSGKTTLVSLIASLLPQDEGELSIDGISYNDLDNNSYRKRIGYITQDSVIFNDTIYNNVTFWSEPTSENLQRFQKAIQQASLSKFLKSLPNGKETELGNNGINLSGGQKQRISIARELYKDIDILIMDEATSSLDSETELAIQQSIDALQGHYTILIVAHRLSTIRNVDKIICMNEGRIENEGSFSDLVFKHPRFKKMVELQEI